jgi:hypothetical protein
LRAAERRRATPSGKVITRNRALATRGGKTPVGACVRCSVLTDYAQGRPRVSSQSPAHVFPPPAGTGGRASPGVDLRGLNTGLRPVVRFTSVFEFLDVRSCGL